ncbi:MAG: GTP cyclohydrolase I [Patescibacteria group bacterium]
MKQPKAEVLTEAVDKFIFDLGLDLKNENFKDTPRRFASTYINLCRGLYEEAQQEITENLARVFPTNYKGMIIQEPIRVYSLCSHHMLPVTYDVLFGYIPSEKTLGFSKSIKVIELLAAKPVSQEDFTQEMVEVFDKTLKPKGLMAVVKGIHMCMLIRSVKSHTVNTTSAVRGVFKDEERTRNEFLRLASFRNGGS